MYRHIIIKNTLVLWNVTLADLNNLSQNYFKIVFNLFALDYFKLTYAMYCINNLLIMEISFFIKFLFLKISLAVHFYQRIKIHNLTNKHNFGINLTLH